MKLTDRLRPTTIAAIIADLQESQLQDFPLTVNERKILDNLQAHLIEHVGDVEASRLVNEAKA